ncbi:LamB/YcsF [Exidia glandulosa HHB12029]|uniref:LamB/YcsF n=1 Tax=Exidia glandulosa HHB12029 TaxID=1314781 RepID=A0A165BVF0_EXIGL|nr:LamB/YcsF [Exidia glandulosa HHB12029]
MAPPKHPVKINVDLGEGYGNFTCGPDEELIRLGLIDHANVASGFHAGDPLIMQQTVKLCKQYNIAVGAHPGLPDIHGFGRGEIEMSSEDMTAMTRCQVGALTAFLDAEGLSLHHVKLHGVLYGMMYRDEDVCRAVYSGAR